MLRKKRRGGLKKAGSSSSSIGSDLGDAAAMATAAVAAQQQQQQQLRQEQFQQQQGRDSLLGRHLAAGGAAADDAGADVVERLDSWSGSADNRSTNSVGLYTSGDMYDTDASSYGGGSHRSPYDGEDESEYSASPDRGGGGRRHVAGHDGADGTTLSGLTGQATTGGDGVGASSSARSFGSNLPITRVKHGYTGQDVDSSRKLNVLESGGKFELDDMSNSQASKEFQRAREQERERLERQRERRERRELKARERAEEEGGSGESGGNTVAADSGQIQGMEALQSLKRVDSEGHLEELKEVESQSLPAEGEDESDHLDQEDTAVGGAPVMYDDNSSNASTSQSQQQVYDGDLISAHSTTEDNFEEHSVGDDMMEEELSDHMEGLDDYANQYYGDSSEGEGEELSRRSDYVEDETYRDESVGSRLSYEDERSYHNHQSHSQRYDDGRSYDPDQSQGEDSYQSMSAHNHHRHHDDDHSSHSNNNEEFGDDYQEETFDDNVADTSGGSIEPAARPPLHQEDSLISIDNTIMAAEAAKLRQELEMELDQEEEDEADEVDSLDQSATMSIDQGSVENVHEGHENTGSPEPSHYIDSEVADASIRRDDGEDSGSEGGSYGTELDQGDYDVLEEANDDAAVEEPLAPVVESSNALSGGESSISDRRNFFTATKYGSAGSAEADVVSNDAVPTTSQGTLNTMNSFDVLAGMDGLSNRWSSTAFLDGDFGGSEFGISSRWGAAAEESRAVYEEREQSRRSLMGDVSTSGASASTSIGALRASRTSSMVEPALIEEEEGEDEDDDDESEREEESAAVEENESGRSGEPLHSEGTPDYATDYSASLNDDEHFQHNQIHDGYYSAPLNDEVDHDQRQLQRRSHAERSTGTFATTDLRSSIGTADMMASSGSLETATSSSVGTNTILGTTSNRSLATSVGESTIMQGIGYSMRSLASSVGTATVLGIGASARSLAMTEGGHSGDHEPHHMEHDVILAEVNDDDDDDEVESQHSEDANGTGRISESLAAADAATNAVTDGAGGAASATDEDKSSNADSVDSYERQRQVWRSGRDELDFGLGAMDFGGDFGPSTFSAPTETMATVVEDSLALPSRVDGGVETSTMPDEESVLEPPPEARGFIEEEGHASIGLESVDEPPPEHSAFSETVEPSGESDDDSSPGSDESLEEPPVETQEERQSYIASVVFDRPALTQPYHDDASHASNRSGRSRRSRTSSLGNVSIEDRLDAEEEPPLEEDEVGPTQFSQQSLFSKRSAASSATDYSSQAEKRQAVQQSNDTDVAASQWSGMSGVSFEDDANEDDNAVKERSADATLPVSAAAASAASLPTPPNISNEEFEPKESSDEEDGVVTGAVAATAAAATAAAVGLGAWFGRKQEEPAPLAAAPDVINADVVFDEDNNVSHIRSIPDSSTAGDASSVNPEIMRLYEMGVITQAEMEQMASADRQFGQKIDADSSHGGDEGDDGCESVGHAASSKDGIIASAAQEVAKGHEESSADKPVEEDDSPVQKDFDQSVSNVSGAVEQDGAKKEGDDSHDSSREASIDIDTAENMEKEPSSPSGEQSGPPESKKNDEQDEGITTSEDSLQERFDSSRKSLMESIARLDETTEASKREYHHDVARSNDDGAGSRRSSTASSEGQSSSDERQVGESLREFWSRRRRGDGLDHFSEDSSFGSASSYNKDTKDEEAAVKAAAPIAVADGDESEPSEESCDAMTTMVTAAAATALVAGTVGVAVASASPDGEPEPSDRETDDKGSSVEEPSEEPFVDVSAYDSTDFPTDGGDEMLEPLSDSEPMDDFFGEEPLSEEEGDDYYGGYNNNSMSESSEDVSDTGLANDRTVGHLLPVVEYEGDEESYSQNRNQSHGEMAYEESPDAGAEVEDRVYDRDAGSLYSEEETAQYDDYVEDQESNAEEQVSTPHHYEDSLKGSSASPEDQSEFEHQDYVSPVAMEEESPGSFNEEEEGQYDKGPSYGSDMYEDSYRAGDEAEHVSDEHFQERPMENDEEEEEEYAKAAPIHPTPLDADNQPRDMTEKYSESLEDDESYQYEQYSASLKGGDSYQEEEDLSEPLKGDDSSYQHDQYSDSRRGESGDSSLAIGGSTSYQQAEYSSSFANGSSAYSESLKDEVDGTTPADYVGDGGGAYGFDDREDRIEGSANDVEEVDEAKEAFDLTPSQEEGEDYGIDRAGYNDYEVEKDGYVDEPYGYDRDQSPRRRDDYDRSHEDEYDNLEPPRLPSHEFDEPASQESFASSVSSVTMLTLEDDPQRKAEVVERKRQERLAALAAAGIAVGAVADGVAEADQREAAALAVEQAAAREAEDAQDSWELRPETEEAEDLFDEEEQLQREMDAHHDRRKREEKARKIARRSLSRPRKAGKRGRVYGNDSLADLEAGIKELRATFDASGERASAKRRSVKASRKSVRSLIKDESDSENERMEAGEKREKQNSVNVVLIGFEGLLEVLLKVSDELVLSSTFRASRLAPDVLNTEALLSLLSYTSSIDVAFSEMRASLLDLHPDGERLEGTADGECIARITKLTSFITAIIKRVSERQVFNAKSATCYVTMLELLQRASGELKYIVDGDEQKEFEVTPQLRRAWTSSGHEAQVRMLEDGPKEDDYYFKLLAMNIVAQMDEWAPSQDDLRFVCCYDISPDEESGFYSSKMADIPQGATELLDRIRGNPLPREDIVSWVLRRLLPSPSDLPSSSNSSLLDDNASVISSAMSLTSGASSRGRRTRGGNIVSLTAAPEDPYDPNSLAFGGVGKSTIAALVATKEQVRKEYNAGIVWIDVGNRGVYGFTYDEYCDVLSSMCLQLKLKDQPKFPELVNVPGESRIELERRESKMMLEARDKVSGLIRGRRGALLLILDDVWRNQDLELFRFKWKKKKLCDILVTTRVQGLLASDFVNIGFLSIDEGIQLLLAEAGQSPDHVMSTSVEAKAIVRECANHPIATKIVARWLGLKHATAGVINSVEEIHEDVAKALERVSVDATSSTGSFGVAGDMLYEILDQSLAPIVDGKTTKAIKLCFAAFVLVFCKYSPTTRGRPTIPSGAVAELFEAVLHTKETDLFGDGNIFEQHFRRATQLIPEALAALGVMTVGKDASSNEGDSTTLQLKHDIMLEYGDYLLSPEGGLGDLVRAELVWNRAFASSYLEDMVGNSAWDVTKPNPGRKYALEFLANHLIRAEMIQEAAVLLRDERFVKGRLLALGMNKGTKKHVQDCEETFDLLLDIRSAMTEPGDFISRAYEKCGAVISAHLSSSHASGSAASGQETVDAGLAYNAMGFSLAERNRWLDATYHYNRSYELLDMALGDNEVVASILFNRAVVYHETNQYEKSMESLDECLNQRTAIYGEQGPLVAQTICEKANVFAAMSDYAAAMYNYRKALDIYQVEPNRNRVEIGNTFQSMGRMHREKGELHQALKLYSDALRCKKIEVGLNHQDLASVYIEMGYCHAEKNDREAAEPIFDEALRLMEQAEPTDENEAELLTIQGIMHNMADEKDEGLECYEQALDILKNKCPQKKGKIAVLLNLIANEHVARGENRRAFKLFEESLKCRKEMVGFVHVDVATTLVNMATLHQQREKWEKALRCLEEALRIRKLRLGDSEKVAQTLELIGNLSKEIGQLKKAEMAYEDALRILRGLHGDNHVSVANILHEMGDLMDDISEYDEAINNFSECLEIRKRALGYDHEDVAETLYSMGFALHNQGKEEEALDCLDDALQVRRQHFGADHELVGDCLNIMGFIESKKGEHEIALELLDEALEIRQNNGSTLKAADTMKNIGNIHKDRKEYVAALDCYEDCLKWRKRELGLNDERVADAQLALGNAYSEMNENEEAMHCFSEALKVRRVVHGSHDDRVASVLQTMGIIEFRAGNMDRGREYLEDFVRIRKNNHTDESADYVNVLFIIGNIHKIEGNDNDAKRAWAEAYDIFNAIGLQDENPQIAKILTKLLNKKDKHGDGASDSKKSVFGRLKSNFTNEKVIRPTKKQPMKDVSGSNSSKRLVIE